MSLCAEKNFINNFTSVAFLKGDLENHDYNYREIFCSVFETFYAELKKSLFSVEKTKKKLFLSYHLIYSAGWSIKAINVINQHWNKLFSFLEESQLKVSTEFFFREIL